MLVLHLLTPVLPGTVSLARQEPETAQKHVDHEDAFAPGEKSLVWRYPGPVFFRKPGDGTVEGPGTAPLVLGE